MRVLAYFGTRLRACWRLVRVLMHIVSGFVTIRLTFSRRTQQQRDDAVQAWALAMLARLAIKLVVNGKPPSEGPVLLASNHISWLDIVVIHAARHCRFISKSEIQHWPLVGTLA
ncbi:MAG: lysophospholipid acyltransferase family protein, partial [Rhodoferax sp.]